MNLPSINVEGSGHAVPTIINDEQTINPQQDSVYIFNLVDIEVWPHLILGTTNVPVGCKVTVIPSSRMIDSGYVTYKNVAKIDNTVFLLTGCSATFVFTDEGTWDVLSGASFYMDYNTYTSLSSSMKQKEPSNWKHITGSGTYTFKYGDQPNSAYMLPKDAETTITVVNGVLYNYSGSSSELLHIPGVAIATAYTDIKTTSGSQKYPTIYTIGGQGNRTGSEGAYVPEITWNTSWELMHKVGQVHNATINANDFIIESGSVCQWVVTNGICNVYIGRITPKRAADPLYAVSSGLPKCKLYTGSPAYNSATSLGGYFYVVPGTTALRFGTTNPSMVWCSFSYPVADDWVE